MKLRSLSALKRNEPRDIVLAGLPQQLIITSYAWRKALAVNGLVRSIHGDSFEWYGFTLGSIETPECVTDIGLPVNDRNVHRYAGIGPENISVFRSSLPEGTIVNGWIHSHGSMDLRAFSRMDEANHLTVLDYVGAFLKKPVARREVVVDDLALISDQDMEVSGTGGGNVWIATDRPVTRARIFELVYGSFCYGILVGDGGWHVQEIWYRTRSILTGTTSVSRKEAELLTVGSGRVFTEKDEKALASEVLQKINPDGRSASTLSESGRRSPGNA